jgi:hypothetical protein
MGPLLRAPHLVRRATTECGDTSIVSLEANCQLIYHEARRVGAAVTAKKMSELLATCEKVLGHEAYLTGRCSMVRVQFTRKAGDPDGIRLYEDEIERRVSSYGPTRRFGFSTVCSPFRCVPGRRQRQATSLTGHQRLDHDQP